MRQPRRRGGTGIVAGDCAQVTKIVLATEMNTRPTASGASLTAPECGAGQVRNSTRFVDDMETSNANWVGTTTGGGSSWGYLAGSSQSGSRSMHVSDVQGPRGTSTLTLSSAEAFVVPTGTTTYLRFDHAFDTDWDSGGMYDGGVVEYSTDDGATWTDVGTLGWIDNGYVAALSSVTSGGLANPLAGRSAFGKISPSYQTSRADLSSLAGSTVRLRFQFATDNYPYSAFEGWFLDDVAVYTCGASASAPDAPDVPTTTVPTTTAAPPTVPVTSPAPATPAPVAPSYAPVTPARLLDTRTDVGLTTADGQFLGGGILAAGSTVELKVAGRAGVPLDAGAAALNVTVTGSSRPGYLTVYPCGTPRPNASSVNHGAGQTIPNLVISGIGEGGRVCIFTLAATHVIVDLNGFQPAAAAYTAVTPRPSARHPNRSGSRHRRRATARRWPDGRRQRARAPRGRSRRRAPRRSGCGAQRHGHRLDGRRLRHGVPLRHPAAERVEREPRGGGDHRQPRHHPASAPTVTCASSPPPRPTWWPT